jgi:hypothetical protein
MVFLNEEVKMLKGKYIQLCLAPPRFGGINTIEFIQTFWQDFKPRGFETYMSRKNLYEIF